jgi:hypothetical protein
MGFGCGRLVADGMAGDEHELLALFAPARMTTA